MKKLNFILTKLINWSTMLPLGVIVLLVVFATSVFAQTDNPYELTWSNIVDGGEESSGGNYSLSGSASQPETAEMSGGSYTLVGGFGGDINVPPIEPGSDQHVYLPIVIKEE